MVIMKKICFLLLIVALSMGLTGCMHQEDSILLNGDGSGEYSSTTLVRDEKEGDLSDVTDAADKEFDDVAGENSDEIVIIDGKTYKKTTESSSFSTRQELKKILEAQDYKNVYVTETGVRYAADAQLDSETLALLTLSDAEIKQKIVITMPEKIIKTNGIISEDGKTAVFEFEGEDFLKPLEVMVSTQSESKKPAISGVTSGKSYNKAVTVTASDLSGIKTAKYKKNSGKYYSFKLSRTFTANGNYTVYATDYYGNKRVKTFTVKDTSRPTVSGVVNNKTYTSPRTITFKDNCAVKKATLNGEKVEDGVCVEEKGTYKLIVYDVNGLKRTVCFTIK